MTKKYIIFWIYGFNQIIINQLLKDIIIAKDLVSNKENIQESIHKIVGVIYKEEDKKYSLLLTNDKLFGLNKYERNSIKPIFIQSNINDGNSQIVNIEKKLYPFLLIAVMQDNPNVNTIITK